MRPHLISAACVLLLCLLPGAGLVRGRAAASRADRTISGPFIQSVRDSLHRAQAREAVCRSRPHDWKAVSHCASGWRTYSLLLQRLRHEEPGAAGEFPPVDEVKAWRLALRAQSLARTPRQRRLSTTLLESRAVLGFQESTRTGLL